VPQAYVSYHTARRACDSAGKRLCTSEEWLVACRGRWRTHYPYGNEFRRVSCNVYRYVHPSLALHGMASTGQLDPRLNLVTVWGTEPLLRDTGASPNCKSPWWDGQAAYDMVGNLDEWVEDERGVFRGGFFSRATTKGCDAQVASHAPDYFDYSTGARCCRDPAPVAPD
jgi:formylglycine-generating enzyme required for sulfatase activity